MTELQADARIAQAQCLVESVVADAIIDTTLMGEETRERLFNIVKDLEAIRMEVLG